MAKEIVGHITCPQCGNSNATVHQNVKTKHYYYRCSDESGDCGTIQPVGARGQAFIKNNMRALQPEPISEPEPTPAPEPISEPEPTPAPEPTAPEPTPKTPAKKPFWQSIFTD